MPYKLIEKKNGHFAVYNPKTKEYKSKDTTRTKAEKQIRLLHMMERK